MKALALVFGLVVLFGSAFGQRVDPTGDLFIEQAPLQPGQTLTVPRGHGTLDEFYTHVDPGTVPEGDYLGGLAFSPDGSKAFVCNRMTDNVTVFDWASMQVLANIPVGRYPAGIAVGSQYAVIACAFGDKVYIVDHATYEVVDSVATGEQPWLVHISPDGRYAYVACDIDDVVDVIDLTTLEPVRQITGFPFGLRSFSFNSGNGRNDVSFTDFLISPDGQHLIASDFDSAVVFINTQTGAVDHTIPGVLGYASLGFSGDSTKLIAVSPVNTPVVYQIDLATRAILNSVSITGYMLYTDGVAVNGDGSKCYIGISDNRSALVRFATSDFITFTQTYTAFWIGTTSDHEYAVSGQYNFALVNFATESVTSISPGNSQSKGAVAAAHGRVVAVDPHRHEGVYFYDITNPSSIAYRGTTMAGHDPEGDAPHYVAITPDGAKALCSHTLSDNVSIIDLASLETDTLLPAGDGPWEIGITADSRYAVVAGFNTNTVPIIDLLTSTVVATINSPGRPSTVSMSPDGEYAYIGNIQGNTVVVIHVDGAASEVIATIPSGEIGIVWNSYGIFSDIEVSPSGRWVLVAASFDDQVKVIDTQTNSVVANLTVGDFPLQFAFDGTDDYAVVTNFYSHNYSVLHLDGASSTVVGTFPCGQYPTRIAYNPVDDCAGIVISSAAQVTRVNPRTGALLGTDNFAGEGTAMQVAYGPGGDAVVMTSGAGDNPPRLHRGDEQTDLPGYPAQFCLNAAGLVGAAAIPGPDVISVVEWEARPHVPSAFSLLTPTNLDTIEFVQPHVVSVSWQPSTDPDPGDVVRYDAHFRLVTTGVDTTIVLRSLSETSYELSLVDSAGLGAWQNYVLVQWRVEAISGTDTVPGRENWVFRLSPPLAGDEPSPGLLPTQLRLSAAYPNPFNPIVNLRYEVPGDGDVNLVVYNAMGQQVATLVEGPRARGHYSVAWNAVGFTSGAYWVRLSSREATDVVRVVLVK